MFQHPCEKGPGYQFLLAVLLKRDCENSRVFSYSLFMSTFRSVPKFMKRMKVPDYKDKNVFGVPLIVHVQRTGQPLPQSIQQALRYLQSNCLDQVWTSLLGFSWFFFWKVILSKQVPELFEGCYFSCRAQISSGDWKLDTSTKGLPFWDLYPTSLLISCSCNSPADFCTIACLKEWHESFMSIE